MRGGPLHRVIGAPPIDEKTRREALADEGPPWKEWFYRSFLKVWIPFGFFVADVWIVIGGVDALGSVLAPAYIAGLVIAVYLEFLAFQVLYYEPHAVSHSVRERREWRWLHPVPWGRWSRAAEAMRRGLPAQIEPTPDAREFL